jgi:hypothetical protein
MNHARERSSHHGLWIRQRLKNVHGGPCSRRMDPLAPPCLLSGWTVGLPSSGAQKLLFSEVVMFGGPAAPEYGP